MCVCVSALQKQALEEFLVMSDSWLTRITLRFEKGTPVSGICRVTHPIISSALTLN